MHYNIRMDCFNLNKIVLNYNWTETWCNKYMYFVSDSHWALFALIQKAYNFAHLMRHEGQFVEST